MISLRDLPLTLRALFSSFLIVIGIGYLSALVCISGHRGSTFGGFIQ
jgi:hypothetical protein